MELDSIYTELIAEESRNPAHRRHLDAPTATLKGKNPSCGDEITLELAVRDGVIAEASFTGAGCAISQASTSMMIDLIQGAPVAEAKRLVSLFLAMARGEALTEEEKEALGDAAALENVRLLPARVKCAVLAWHTLDGALGTEKETRGEKR